MCAELERAAIAERVTAARRRIEAGGGTWDRPPKVTEKQRQQIRKMAADDWSIRSIAEEIGLAPSTIHRVLSQKPTPKSSVLKVKKKPLSRVAVVPFHSILIEHAPRGVCPNMRARSSRAACGF